eukprot:14130-Heterococcus_DN1.PRE.1
MTHCYGSSNALANGTSSSILYLYAEHSSSSSSTGSVGTIVRMLAVAIAAVHRSDKGCIAIDMFTAATYELSMNRSQICLSYKLVPVAYSVTQNLQLDEQHRRPQLMKHSICTHANTAACVTR